MGVLHQAGKLQCPYSRCNKTFEKPIVLTDKTKIVRETYYACPHCRSRIEIAAEDPTHPRLIQVETSFSIGQREPARCKYTFGYLGELPHNVDIPDECAVCPKVMQCFVRRHSC